MVLLSIILAKGECWTQEFESFEYGIANGLKDEYVDLTWRNTFMQANCNSSLGQSTQVDKYPGGESPFKVADMVGNIWQLTNDVYDNGNF